MRDFANPFRVVHGTLRDARASAFAIVKDEMFYLPSFLDHHRRLGVDQFVILDDQSSDGTRGSGSAKRWRCPARTAGDGSGPASCSSR